MTDKPTPTPSDFLKVRTFGAADDVDYMTMQVMRGEGATHAVFYVMKPAGVTWTNPVNIRAFARGRFRDRYGNKSQRSDWVSMTCSGARYNQTGSIADDVIGPESDSTAAMPITKVCPVIVAFDSNDEVGIILKNDGAAQTAQVSARMMNATEDPDSFAILVEMFQGIARPVGPRP